MHPNKSFAWTETDALLGFVAQRSFSTIAASVDQRILIAHTPVIIVRSPDRLQFHLAVGNALTQHLDDCLVTIITQGVDGYISPDWYISENQVPTWNYQAVEFEGVSRLMSEAELVTHVDSLSAIQEARLIGKAPWTHHKMTGGSFDSMLKAIRGFEVAIKDIRGTTKLSQNKSDDDFYGAHRVLNHLNPALATAMLATRSKY
jgi:transcriptional regulator